ncbi:kinesin KIF13A, putative [Babesia ovata]|uniref:Kinesin KIF13A, putative n=1 Tax=Babesia ovata TaxID=189622 RepID=A0A2H6KFU8_9APIC|nr:kinesin KIF13A, putative [Babesia ovata]GBE61870.1 kinesin KIF13A, putative [Babesia ovata]
MPLRSVNLVLSYLFGVGVVDEHGALVALLAFLEFRHPGFLGLSERFVGEGRNGLLNGGLATRTSDLFHFENVGGGRNHVARVDPPERHTVEKERPSDQEETALLEHLEEDDALPLVAPAEEDENGAGFEGGPDLRKARRRAPSLHATPGSEQPLTAIEADLRPLVFGFVRHLDGRLDSCKVMSGVEKESHR